MTSDWIIAAEIPQPESVDLIDRRYNHRKHVTIAVVCDSSLAQPPRLEVRIKGLSFRTFYAEHSVKPGHAAPLLLEETEDTGVGSCLTTHRFPDLMRDGLGADNDAMEALMGIWLQFANAHHRALLGYVKEVRGCELAAKAQEKARGKCEEIDLADKAKERTKADVESFLLGLADRPQKSFATEEVPF